MTEILKGKPVADAMIEAVARKRQKLRGATPHLAIVRVGAKPDDISYERGIKKKCEAAGVECTVRELPDEVSEASFRDVIGSLNADEAVHGILPFRPLPTSIPTDALKMMSPTKDVDCVTAYGAASIYDRSIGGYMPCTADAVIEMLRYYRITLKGARAAVIGRSPVVGRALALMLTDEDCTVTLCHSRTTDIRSICREAEIVVTACGRPRFVGPDFVKQDAAVIDVGINIDESGTLCGDADTEALKAAGIKAITPVPGGVGAVTSAILVRNTVDACEKAAARRGAV